MSNTQNNVSIAEEISMLKESLDDSFLFLNAVTICLMQLGFACVEVGSVRRKNSASVLMKNILDMFVCAVTFWLVGYSLAYGTGNSFLGISLWGAASISHQQMTNWFFQLSFTAAASTIVSGAVAERCTLIAYLIYTIFISGLIYPIVVHWAWSEDGWLTQLGYKDLAGSGVVHLLGGTCALVGTYVLGSRLGRFEPTKTEGQNESKKENPCFVQCSLACAAHPIPGHSTLLVGIGGLILAVTFLSFNGASIGQVSGGPGQDSDAASTVAINTILGGSGAVMVTMCALKIHSLRFPKCISPRWDLGMTMNAALTGMVSLCAGADVLSQWTSLCTGLIAGVMFLSTKYILNVLKIDDPTDVVPIHYGGGLWGVLARPLFTFPHQSTSSSYFTYGYELLYNVTGAIAILSWSSSLSFLVFYVMKKVKLLRVSPEYEMLGLDSSYELKVYNDDMVLKSMSNEELTVIDGV